VSVVSERSGAPAVLVRRSEGLDRRERVGCLGRLRVRRRVCVRPPRRVATPVTGSLKFPGRGDTEIGIAPLAQILLG
jgi:hypothetical protein